MTHAAEPMDIDLSFIEDSSHENGEIINDDEESLKPSANHRNNNAPFVTGIDIFCKEEQSKLEMRAKRFGLDDKVKNPPLEMDENFYTSMGITDENESTKNLRMNVLHMRGTEDMSTKDVFKYFEHYAPASIEWINDFSCNVVWHDNISAARALLRLSKKIVGLDEQSSIQSEVKPAKNTIEEKKKIGTDNVDDDTIEEGECKDDEIPEKADDEDVVDIKEVNYPLPPGPWRKGVDYPKSKCIFLRFATRADRKQPGAEKMSVYYKKYGNPNFGGIKGLLTESRKRVYKEALQSRRQVEEEQPIDVDDDEIYNIPKKPYNIGARSGNDDVKSERKNPWGTLSKTWGLNDPKDEYYPRRPVVTEQSSGIKGRLGVKNDIATTSLPVQHNVDKESDEETDSDSSDDQWCKRSKVLRMRMHADDEEEKLRKKKNNQIVNTQKKMNDLRSRLENPEKIEYKIIEPGVIAQMVHTRLSSQHWTEWNYQPKAHLIQDEETMSESLLETGEFSDWLPEQEEEEEEEAEEEEEEEEEEVEVEEVEGKTEGDDYEKSEDSDISEKEVQGPKGSVIKVVPRVKPRVASTVWARLNNTNSRSQATSDRSSAKGSLRGNLQGDLRSRLGYHKRGRSPLRIEVKNDKYAEESSGTE